MYTVQPSLPPPKKKYDCPRKLTQYGFVDDYRESEHLPKQPKHCPSIHPVDIDIDIDIDILYGNQTKVLLKLFDTGNSQKEFGRYRISCFYTIFTTYLSLCTQTGETTSPNPFHEFPCI